MKKQTRKVKIVNFDRNSKYSERYFVIIPDVASGRDNRYHVWFLQSSNIAELIGNEIPLKDCWRVIKIKRDLYRDIDRHFGKSIFRGENKSPGKPSVIKYDRTIGNTDRCFVMIPDSFSKFDCYHLWYLDAAIKAENIGYSISRKSCRESIDYKKKYIQFMQETFNVY